MKTEIKSIANTKLSLIREEFEYCTKLISLYGEDIFRGLFQTDNHGNIIAIAPHTQQPTPMPVLFFLLNISFNQRMRSIEKIFDRLDKMDEKIKTLESKIK